MKVSLRQAEIIAMAAGPDSEPAHIEYTLEENQTWQTITGALSPMWQEHAAERVLEASATLSLPTDHIPQLTDVTEVLKQHTGFIFRAVGGLAPRQAFFSGLAEQQFLSTQFIRGASSPFYTEQPDVVHELLGHATLLADRDFAELHRQAGAALTRVETEAAKQFIANVWWFSGEFGVTRNGGRVKAVGAGILSSLNELEHASVAELAPLDPVAMGVQAYRIDHLQPKLFAAESCEHLINEVGSFFDAVSDGAVLNIMKEKFNGTTS